jgi:hypothetical protein
MNDINEELVRALRDNTPNKENTVNLLMDILTIGKEAAYRRLRGETSFTLSEAVLIGKKLNISIDRLMNKEHCDLYDFRLQAFFLRDPLGELYKMLFGVTTEVEKISADPDSFSYRAYRALPSEFFFRYKFISKVYMYILFYQLQPHNPFRKLADLYVPEKIFDLQYRVSDAIHNIVSTIILDKHIGEDFIGIVKYFAFMGLFDKDEVEHIKEDLHGMINDIERCASTGLSLTGKKIDIYISNISFDSSYSYSEGAGIKSGAITLYCVDYLSCSHPDVAENQRLWIKSLIRFSTQISVSGEFQRNEHFRRQRELVDNMSGW